SLNANFVDLDCYRKKLSFEAARCRVSRMVRAGIIPKPSMIANSGRGMWLFWLLHDEKDRNLPPKGDPKYYANNFHLWRIIQEALISRLRHLGADPVAKD